ncbi:MAG TPA: glutamate--tRNA ligase [Candidatus Saccharimonadia bacterium]|nr:glutamate--tRNA ligase [Candidatus Saccharimonadia bacterium]
MSKSVRVRFAPSPTGHLHVGGVRSGLFNWLWARHTGGVFVLRIEDTDRGRLVEDAVDQINDSLEALGIAPDEGIRQGGEYGPYLQSERKEQGIYDRYAKELVEKGVLYRCWCSAERLTTLREEAQAKGVAFKYDRFCLQESNKRAESEPHVLRFKIPEHYDNSKGLNEFVNWDDAVRGEMSFALKDLDDFVAMKSDDFPTYHFANVVDDHLMKISHVLRADEWLPSTPKHLLLFAAFGWEAPTYVHLPPVQGPDGRKKLSKRDGAQSVQEYITEGYLPEALRSFLASLGWNDGTTQEVYSTDELIKNFTLERVQKSPAKFDKERLTWMNGYMIRHMALPQLLEHSRSFLPASSSGSDDKYLLEVLKLVQERVKFLNELPELTDFFFEDPKPALNAEDAGRLPAVTKTLSDSDFSESDLESRLRTLAEELEVKPGVLFSAIRITITGKKAAPGLFETLHVLGKETSLRRLAKIA